MEIRIRNSDPEPIYRQIVQQIQQQILEGRLPVGSILPSIRLLAKELRISVITTKRAYQELESMGLIETKAGKGCFVAGINVTFLREQRLRKMEEILSQAVEEARLCGVEQETFLETAKLFWERD